MSQNAITLTGGMRKNLYSLQSTNNLLERTQSRMASGLRVQTAVDDPVNYFTGLSHRQRAEDLGSRKDEMSESIQTVMSANEGVTAITSLIASAKSLAQSALSAGTEEEVTTLEGQYNEVLSQINQLVNDSGYKGVNLLGGSDVEHEVKFNEDGSSLLTMTGFDATTEGLNITQVGAELEAVTGEAASVTIGDDSGNGAVTITASDEGVAGNDITVQFVNGTGNNSALDADITDGVITVTLATDGSGDPDDTANTAALVAAAINGLTGVSASESGTGADAVTAMAEPVSLEGGVDEVAEGTTAPGWWSAGEGEEAGSVNKSVIGDAILELDAARTTLRSESQKLSTNLSTITIRQEFTQGMINTLQDGAAELTNADMNEEGANMLMLQTRQSLGTTSLSLASQAAQSVLRLF
ncbi:flagellin [Desulfatitalea alkaliphila]|uniref:Flagellin n=1 Tax=Desulfatitalea alkaliphila TaxID=2929485 RepID=A0AA41R8Q4_9BACT|nr:flagellin [Desulfatitalea alkaliphila]MCJ8503125.1 flagellin [Desulfatitalea alkaliphila]